MTINSRYRQSQELANRAAQFDAWVSAEISNPARQNYQFINGNYPLYASHAEGGYLWDIDGNRYIDFNLGYGTVILGHRHPGVTQAVKDEIEKGHCLSPLWKPQQAALCELICQVSPHAEQAFLMKTGSDASSGAVRLARLFTGRARVLRWGYNGWHDWSTPRPGGVPKRTRDLISTFTYNDLESVEQAFDRFGSEIACVFMMPFEVEPPRPGFLEGVREIAHRHGALFILDEMRSGFRFALGGAQEYLGINADLVTYSKAMANGYAISCIAGRRDILSGIADTKMTATYFTSAEAMAAAMACIRTIAEEGVVERIWSLGEAFKVGLSDMVQQVGEGMATVKGLPPCPMLEFDNLDEESAGRAKAVFFSETARQGIFLHPSHHWYVCAAHTLADIAWTIEVCAKAMKLTKDQLCQR